MVVDQSEQVVPSSNQLALCLVLDKLDLLGSPQLLDPIDEVFKNSFASSLGQNIVYCLVPSEQVSAPQIAQKHIIEFDCDSQLSKQILPVLGLHSVSPQIIQNIVYLFVILHLIGVALVDLVGPHTVGELSQFVLFCV